MTTPPDIGLRDWSIDFSPVICLEWPLSKYNDLCFFPTIKEVYNRNYFILRYPIFFGSFFLVSLWVWLSTGWTLWWVALYREVLVLMSFMTHFYTKVASSDFFTMYNLLAFETMARFVLGVSLHLSNFVKGFMTTNKFAKFISQGFYLLMEFYNLMR